MVFTTIPALTETLTLDEFAVRLASHAAVDGILFMGSTGSGALNAASDYDLLLILADDPAAPRMIVTWVDGHFTEIYCTPITALARIVAEPTAWREGSDEGAVINWLRDGRIVHDRAGRLAGAQAIARAALPLAVAAPEGAYWAWGALGYNVAQSKRYLASDDPIYREVVDFRLLYGLAEVMKAYFTVRGLPWRGEKEAIRHWTAHDPAYLTLFRSCLAETDRARKVAHYEELARRTLVPVGELWAAGTAMVGAGAGWGAGPDAPRGSIEIEETNAFWQAMVTPRNG